MNFETYYEGTPLWVFNTNEVELKLKILSKLEQTNGKIKDGDAGDVTDDNR